MDLLAYWQLKERPFETVWDARFFFPSRAHDEALHRLRYLGTERTMSVGLLTGEIGCGKTLTCAVFRDQLDPDTYNVATFPNAGFGIDDVLAGLLDGLQVPVPSGRLAAWRALESALNRSAAAGRHLIVMFDEAQDFEVETLRELKALTNLNGDGRALVTLVFAGQPELQGKIAQVPSLDQRVGLRFHLRALDRDETMAYLEHRLRTAGHATGKVFSETALEYIFRVSRGIPRELNRLAKLAIEHAWVAGAKDVTIAAVDAVVADHARHSLIGIQ